MAEKTTNYNLTKPSADDFYDVGVQNANMDIVDAELNKLEDGKAPSGHGLGDIPDPNPQVTFQSVMKKGCGFYQVNNAEDNPVGRNGWMSMLQFPRIGTEGNETGVQLVMADDEANPQMWVRAMQKGTISNWFEMLHTGNYSNYANARITTGSYVGWVTDDNTSSEIVLSFDFAPKFIILRGKTAGSKEFTATFLRNCDGNFIIVGASNSVGSHTVSTIWEGNSVKLALDKYDSKSLNWTGHTYTYVAIG